MTALTNIEFTPGTVITSAWLNGVNDALNNVVSGTSGTTARTLTNKITEFISVKDFGAVGDGVTDDTTAIQAAISAVSTNGGIVNFPAGSYKITSTIRISNNHIYLVGEGGTVDGNVVYVGGMTAALASLTSKLVWAGASSGTAVQWTPYPDDGTKAALNGGGMIDIAIDGANIAGVGLDVRTVRYGRWENVSVLRCTAVNTKLGTTASNVTGGNKSIAFCTFRNFISSNSTIGGNTAKTLVLYGHATDGNVAINEFDNCGFYNASGTGSHIEVENCDSNTFMHCRWNGSLTLHATDTGTYSTTDAVARHNVFVSTQGHIIAKAKIATPHTQGTNGYDSYGNVAYGYSLENGVAYPTIEAYADFQYHTTALGLTNKEGGIRFGHAPNITMMSKTTNQTMTSGATTVVDWDAVSYDWLSCGDATGNKITAPNGAKWGRFIYGVEWANNSTAGRFVGIRQNGSDVISKNQNSGYINSQEVVASQWFALNPGDYFEMVVSQNTGANLDLLGTTATFIQAEWM